MPGKRRSIAGDALPLIPARAGRSVQGGQQSSPRGKFALFADAAENVKGSVQEVVLFKGDQDVATESRAHIKSVVPGDLNAYLPGIDDSDFLDTKNAAIVYATNLMNLRQNTVVDENLRTMVENLTIAIESIPQWRIDPSYTSDSTRTLMLLNGIDHMTETVGGFAFVMTIGTGNHLRVLSESTEYLFSASAQKMAQKMVDLGFKYPRFSVQHTPLMYAVMNSSEPRRVSEYMLQSLVKQKRANYPPGHVEMQQVLLLPQGNPDDGVLFGFADGEYPPALVKALHTVTRRFVEGVAAVCIRMREAETRKLHAEEMHFLNSVRSHLVPSMNAIGLMKGNIEEKVSACMYSISSTLKSSACFFPMTERSTSAAVLTPIHGVENKPQFSKGLSHGVSNLVDANADGRSEHSRVSHHSRNALANWIMTNLVVQEPLFSSAYPVSDELKPAMKSDSLRKQEFVDPLAFLANVTATSTFTSDAMLELLAGRAPLIVPDVDILGDVLKASFVPEKIDDMYIIAPVWFEDSPYGILVLAIPQEESASATKKLGDLVSCLFAEQLYSMAHETKKTVDALSDTFPRQLVDRVMKASEARNLDVMREPDAAKREMIEASPIWFMKAASKARLSLMQADLINSTGLGEDWGPIEKQGVFQELWATIHRRAQEHSAEHLVFVKTIGDAIVYASGIDKNVIDMLFKLGMDVHTTADLVGKRRGFEKDTLGFRCGIVTAKEANELMFFLQKVAGQLRFDYTGKYADFVARTEAAAPHRAGILCDVTSLEYLKEVTTPSQIPKIVYAPPVKMKFKGLSGDIEMYHVTSIPTKPHFKLVPSSGALLAPIR